MFEVDPNQQVAMSSLSPARRVAFAALTAGGILPMLFIGTVRPIFWVVALQLACVSGLAYIRWRSPTLNGSLTVLIVSVVACLVSLAAAVAA